MFKRSPRQQMNHEARHFENDQAKFDAELETGFRCARLIIQAAHEHGLEVLLVDGQVTIQGGHVPGRLMRHVKEWEDHLKLYLLNDGKPTVKMLLNDASFGFAPDQPLTEPMKAKS